jgi:hypothetical protein
MNNEKCYKHPDQNATSWREAFIFGEPDRVPLCSDCILQDIKFVTIYPLSERRIYENKYSG